MDEAVARTCDVLTLEQRIAPHLIPPSDVIRYYHGLGPWLRDNFGAWEDSRILRDACQARHPDRASGVISQKASQTLHTLPEYTDP